jgi:Fic family protein
MASDSDTLEDLISYISVKQQFLLQCPKSKPTIEIMNRRHARDLSYTSSKVEGNKLTKEADSVLNNPSEEIDNADEKAILHHFSATMDLLKHPPTSLTAITEEFLFKLHEQVTVSDLPPGEILADFVSDEFEPEKRGRYRKDQSQ